MNYHSCRKSFIWIRYIIVHLFCGPAEVMFASKIREIDPFEVLVYSILAISLTFAISLYFILYFSNPGYLPRPFEPEFVNSDFLELKLVKEVTSNSKANDQTILKSQSSDNLTVPMLDNDQEDISKDADLESRLCSICDIYKPPRSKHCYTCHRCVARFDHHCPLIGNCIGVKNHRLFYLFLFFEEIALITSIYINIDSVRAIDFQSIQSGLQYSMIVYLFVGFVIVIGFSVYVTLLLIFHTFLVLKNQTTYEFILFWRASKESSSERQKPLPKIYDKGVCSNVYTFCAALGDPAWIKTATRLQLKLNMR